MTERWVCKRCFADNDETDTACVNCGLTRGAEASEADQDGWSGAQPAQASEAPAWQGLLRFWWIPVLVVVLVVGYLTAARRGDDGALTAAGTVTVDELRVGDCFNSGDELEISDVDGVPCDEPHAYEVFAVEDIEADSYPTDAELTQIFSSICVPAFESYVGTAYASSQIYATTISPTEDGWNDGDRQIICYLYEPTDETLADEVMLTESMRGARR